MAVEPISIPTPRDAPSAAPEAVIQRVAERLRANNVEVVVATNGFAAEYDVERKFRETRLLTVAPISNNLVLAYLGQHVLGMPKSY